MDGTTFWERAKPLIKAHNLSQKQFADHLGVSINTLQGWIKHERVPETSMAYRVAISLGVTLDYLFSGKERDIAMARYKELTAKQTAARMAKLAEQIIKEAEAL